MQQRSGRAGPASPKRNSRADPSHEPGESRGATPADIRIGPKLKQVRLLRGLTLRQVAEIAACSESLLSKIENGKSNPSLTMLHCLAVALGTSIAAFLPAMGGEERIVSQPRDRPSFTTQDGGIRVEPLVPTGGIHLLQGFLHWVQPGAGYEGVVVQHQGEELGLVLEGQIELLLDGVTYLVGTGASFHFRSELPHGYRNSGATPARIVWVSTPPTF